MVSVEDILAPRIRLEVRPVGYGIFGWQVTVAEENIAWFRHKTEAISYAATYGKDLWQKERILCQLFIKGHTGKVLDKRTYGIDPRESKGQ